MRISSPTERRPVLTERGEDEEVVEAFEAVAEEVLDEEVFEANSEANGEDEEGF